MNMVKEITDDKLASLKIENTDLTKRYEVLKDKVIIRRVQFQKLIECLEETTDWLNSPASIKYHLNKPHGLLEHSVNVAETMLSLKKTLAPEIPDESCVIVGLLHDLGKAGVPGNPQYLKNEPSEKQKWAGYSANVPYKYNSDLVYLSVPIRSLYLILPKLPLTEEEVQAIAYHDGQYVDDNRSVAAKEEKLTLLLQYSDNWNGFMKEISYRYSD